ncbi:hypothetical protein POTOM_056997 [Populus tomentosa]|uniref:Uncharacterized protein n=1 Tax=Populus tomentosa TaxID=118781 RepID=A0A8X8BXE5_POPTO|nr:hypothetical protein POTOM_056997 [Populus tomentosa]
MLQRAPDTGELVIIGVDATKPFLELGLVSDSITWFQVESNCALHLLNCFEEGTDEKSTITLIINLLYLTFQQGGQSEELIKVEYHKSEQNTFCTGAALVPKQGSHEEDGWIITFVHNEDTSMSKEDQFCTLVHNNYTTLISKVFVYLHRLI